MSTVIANQRVSRFQIYNIVVALTISYAFTMLVLKSEVDYQESVKTELRHAQDSTETEVWESIDKDTRIRHQEYLYDSGLFRVIKKWFIPLENDSPVNNTFSGEWNYRAVNNFQVLFFQTSYRISLLKYWGVMLLPLFIAFVITGYNAWRIKQYRLGGVSANKVRLWLKVVWASTVMMIVFIITPNIFGQYTFYAPAGFILICAMTVSKLIESFQKTF